MGQATLNELSDRCSGIEAGVSQLSAPSARKGSLGNAIDSIGDQHREVVGAAQRVIAAECAAATAPAVTQPVSKAPSVAQSPAGACLLATAAALSADICSAPEQYGGIIDQGADNSCRSLWGPSVASLPCSDAERRGSLGDTGTSLSATERLTEPVHGCRWSCNNDVRFHDVEAIAAARPWQSAQIAGVGPLPLSSAATSVLSSMSGAAAPSSASCDMPSWTHQTFGNDVARNAYEVASSGVDAFNVAGQPSWNSHIADGKNMSNVAISDIWARFHPSKSTGIGSHCPAAFTGAETLREAANVAASADLRCATATSAAAFPNEAAHLTQQPPRVQLQPSFPPRRAV